MTIGKKWAQPVRTIPHGACGIWLDNRNGWKYGKFVKANKWRKILLCAIAMICVLVYVWIHEVLLLPEFPNPTITFQRYTNSPTGQRYAIAAVTNNDICAITFHEPFFVIPNNVTNPIVGWLDIETSLTNQTLAPGGSCIATFQVPHAFVRYTNNLFVECGVSRHTLMQRSFGWLVKMSSSHEDAEGKLFP